MSARFSLAISAFAIFTSSLANAGQDLTLRLGPKPASIYGVAPAGTALSAIFFYTPNDVSLAQKKCEFADDFINPNGKDKVASAIATKAGNQYNLSYSMTASRGQCQYHITTIYFSFVVAKVYEVITIIPKDLAQPNEFIPVAEFKSFSPMYCDFQGIDNSFCSVDLESRIYTFSPSADDKIEFNLKDNSEMPPVADPDAQTNAL